MTDYRELPQTPGSSMGSMRETSIEEVIEERMKAAENKFLASGRENVRMLGSCWS